MANLRNRISKAEEAYKALTGGEEKKVLFWREDPDVTGELEKHFMEENPDFKGEIIVFSFGRENLDPDILET